jgi:hypothetical protein
VDFTDRPMPVPLLSELLAQTSRSGTQQAARQLKQHSLRSTSGGQRCRTQGLDLERLNGIDEQGGFKTYPLRVSREWMRKLNRPYGLQ